MSGHRNLSWNVYLAALLTGSGIHTPQCLVIPGWRWDFVYSIGSDGHRRCRYVPSRIARLVQRPRRTFASVWRAVTCVPGILWKFGTSDHPAAKLMRRFVGMLGSSLVKWAAELLIAWLEIGV